MRQTRVLLDGCCCLSMPGMDGVGRSFPSYHPSRHSSHPNQPQKIFLTISLAAIVVGSSRRPNPTHAWMRISSRLPPASEDVSHAHEFLPLIPPSLTPLRTHFMTSPDRSSWSSATFSATPKTQKPTMHFPAYNPTTASKTRPLPRNTLHDFPRRIRNPSLAS